MLKIRPIVKTTLATYLDIRTNRPSDLTEANATVNQIADENGFDEDECHSFGSGVLRHCGFTIWGDADFDFHQKHFERKILINKPPKRSGRRKAHA